MYELGKSSRCYIMSLRGSNVLARLFRIKHVRGRCQTLLIDLERYELAFERCPKFHGFLPAEPALEVMPPSRKADPTEAPYGFRWACEVLFVGEELYDQSVSKHLRYWGHAFWDDHRLQSRGLEIGGRYFYCNGSANGLTLRAGIYERDSRTRMNFGASSLFPV